MTYGQITESEAGERGLTGDADSIVGGDGRTRFFNTAACLWWLAVADLPENPQPPGWKGGVPS